MKVKLHNKARVLFPYSTIDFTTEFEGSVEEWEKVRKEIVPSVSIG